MNNKKPENAAPSAELTENERIAIKYNFLRDKILFHFKRGSRYLKIAKLVATVVFLAYTVIAVIVSQRTSHEMQWLQMWIIFIFVNVAIFIIADYSKYLIESKVIPYLKDDEQIEFGEYDIFLEDIDGETDDDDGDGEDE
ncbi:MAG: hypothetical protein IJ235_06700 [Eubacterium sp.]|nr:hypothetical protein [Eubacterium sp.]MBQ8980597.1 hypothetical protein [Eubacterium sp.]MBR1532625.1 hypothetical protein [Eubacterium sp.]MBR2279253.1 hypothetical protein [Eubacterium sp.]